MKKVVLGLIFSVLTGATAFAQAPTIALLNADIYSQNYFNRNYQPWYCTNTLGLEWTLGKDEYNRYWKGWLWLLTKPAPQGLGLVQGTHFNVITDSQITTANFPANFSKTTPGYRILILSNTVSMSSDQMQIIHRWVLAGGKLLATFGAGYEEIVTRPENREGLIRDAKGHTGGLHELWQDPLNKLFTSTAVAHFTNIKITNNSAPGPVAGVTGNLAEDNMQAFYGRWANMLIQRPEDHRPVYATLRFYNFGTSGGQTVWIPVEWPKSQPAILSSSKGKGWVIYYAFSPEFNISLEFPAETAGKCAGDNRDFTNASAGVIPIMKATMNYLMNLQLKFD